MRKLIIGVVAILVLASLAAYSFISKKSQDDTPQITNTYAPDSAKDEIPDLTNITPPTQEDINLAKSIDKEIVEIAFEYLRTHGYNGHKANPNAIFNLRAARRIDNFILLSISLGRPAGATHLIYSPESKSIVGTFVWYLPQ
jgi:cytochrome oxidase Cu insertion factor (SCO1/SenC/PrrC family)